VPKATVASAASKPLSLPVKILIASIVGLVAVGAIVGPAVYFGLAGNFLTLSHSFHLFVSFVR